VTALSREIASRAVESDVMREVLEHTGGNLHLYDTNFLFSGLFLLLRWWQDHRLYFVGAILR
jgi:hypothetical protein